MASLCEVTLRKISRPHNYERIRTQEKCVNDPDWPVPTNTEEEILTCKCCYFPIMYKSDIITEILNKKKGSNLAIVVPMSKLFKQTRLLAQDCFEPWHTAICCPLCGVFLNLHSPNTGSKRIFRELSKPTISDDQIAFLNSICEEVNHWLHFFNAFL